MEISTPSKRNNKSDFELKEEYKRKYKNELHNFLFDKRVTLNYRIIKSLFLLQISINLYWIILKKENKFFVNIVEKSFNLYISNLEKRKMKIPNNLLFRKEFFRFFLFINTFLLLKSLTTDLILIPLFRNKETTTIYSMFSKKTKEFEKEKNLNLIQEIHDNLKTGLLNNNKYEKEIELDLDLEVKNELEFIKSYEKAYSYDSTKIAPRNLYYRIKLFFNTPKKTNFENFNEKTKRDLIIKEYATKY